MISYLEGQATPSDNFVIIITAGGVGYKVFLGPTLLAQVLTKTKVELYTYAHIREDKFDLYGFANLNELKLCETLLTVSGCGPKMAQQMIDAGASRVINAIQNADISFFTGIPRVGKKLAQKIIIELKGKLGGAKDLDLSPKTTKYQDAYQGLQALGFSNPEIQTALSSLDVDNMPLEDAIKQGIKNATKR